MRRKSEAVLVIDMVNDFVTGKLRCERADRIIPNLTKFLAEARKQGVPVIYAGDAHLKEDFELRVWGEHAMKGSEGAEVIPELKPEHSDYLVEKRTYSAFFETGLDQLLRGLGVTKLYVTGLHTNICDRHTSADAFFRGYNLVILQDGVEAFDEKAQNEGLEYLKTNYGAEIKTTEEVIKAWQAQATEVLRN
ncbi:MAG: isochorismatase family cysteine hydrolase [Ignavibacteria bacterium]|nr:isochorismatase family cysteine hydrolase [Ignavibacteria bacterium]